MTEASTPPDRTFRMREDEENFYLALKPPFRKREVGYRRLQFLGDCTVHGLKGGVQVFVFPREEFNPDDVMESATEYGFTDTELFRDRVMVEVERMKGNVAIDPEVERIGAKAVPSPAAV